MLSLSLDANLVLKEWEHNGGSMFAPGNHAMETHAWAAPRVPHMDTFHFDTAAVGENSCHSEHGESSHGASCAAVPSLDPFGRSATHVPSSSGENDAPLSGIVPELFTAGSFDFGFADDFGQAAGDNCLHAVVFDKLPVMHGNANQKGPRAATAAAAAGHQSDDSAGVVPCVPFQHTSHAPAQQPQQQGGKGGKQRRRLEEGSGSVDPPASPVAAVGSTQEAAPWYHSTGFDAWNGADDVAVVPDASCLGALSGRGGQPPSNKRGRDAAAAEAAAEAAALAAAAALVPQAPSMPADVAAAAPKTSKRRTAAGAQLSRLELQAMMEAARPSAHAFEVPTVSPRPVAGAAVAGDQQPEFHRTRAECLARYREKKARRSHAKKIRYHLRKINADKRPRVKGRFVKKEELAAYLASIGASAPADDDAAADSPSAQQAAAPSPAGRRRGATAAARNAPDAGGSSGSGRRGGAGVGGAHKGATGAAAAAALALHAGAAGGSLSEMEQHDQMLYSMLQLHGADMDMLLESDDELEQEMMEQLMVVPTVPM